ncbi:MAG: hypothetical protein GX075_12855 [Firmicutes bacterium]|nr:hypothetical protein [Bacillota bacterium]
MLNTVHYTLRTTSATGDFINAVVAYEVYYDRNRGIAYRAELEAPPTELSRELETVWLANILNTKDDRRLEYDILQRIYYQTRQTINVERALYRLQEDLLKFLESENKVEVGAFTIEGRQYPGYRLNTLTIWYDPVQHLPVRRLNVDRGNVITDEFTYHSVNSPLPAEVFTLPKPAEAIADFDLYPEAPTLPRFETVTESPQYGVYVNTLLEAIKRHVILNQWEYGPFSTIKLPWLTEMPVTVYRRRTNEVFPPLIVTFDVPEQGRTYFFITYDFLGYVVTGFTPDFFDLSGYEALPLTLTVTLEDLIPLYAAPSSEKNFVVDNFLISVQSNDFFINAFDMGGKTFDLTVKNFSFHENEGYLLLNVYGKEYWDNANLEAMFNFVTTGQMVDAHTTPLLIYALNTLKRMGIYREITMPVFTEIPTPA